MTNGLLLNGQLLPTPGITVVPPASHGGPDWNYLHAGDYAMRHAAPHLVLDHTTGGHWPQRVLPGAGPPGHAERIAKMWSGQDRGDGKRIHSGAPFLVDFDGVIYCLQDSFLCAAYHAELANDASVGVEHCTTPDGSIYQVQLDTSAIFHKLLCAALSIPHQVHAAPYRNQPLARCETGRKTAAHDGRVQSRCADLYGILQHRDQTSERGRGDAGDALVAAHLAAGAEGLDYDRGEDLGAGRERQAFLNRRDAELGNTIRPLVVDGLVGPSSIAAARRLGYDRWRDVGCAERAA